MPISNNVNFPKPCQYDHGIVARWLDLVPANSPCRRLLARILISRLTSTARLSAVLWADTLVCRVLRRTVWAAVKDSG